MVEIDPRTAYSVVFLHPAAQDRSPYKLQNPATTVPDQQKTNDLHQIPCRKVPLNGPDLPTRLHPIGYLSHHCFKHSHHWSTLRYLDGSSIYKKLKKPKKIQIPQISASKASLNKDSCPGGSRHLSLPHSNAKLLTAETLSLSLNQKKKKKKKEEEEKRNEKR